MNRRELILQELQLTPFWIRRELLQQEALSLTVEAETLPPAASIAEVPGLEADARHPLPAVARAANRALAPLVQKTSTPVAKALVTDVSDERSLRIAAMSWDELQAAVQQCTACDLCKTRSHAVFGVGNPKADLVVVGEAPGEEEDRQGEPFVGRAGRLLDAMLAAIGERRGERVFIANVLKCRPPGNRNPSPEEVRLCTPFLVRQLQLIGPQALFAAGRFAAHSLLNTEAPLSALRGKTQFWQDKPVVVSYHPAYLLRNLPDKSKSWLDLLQLQTILAAKSAAER